LRPVFLDTSFAARLAIPLLAQERPVIMPVGPEWHFTSA
jgi:hypothetical protein